MRVGYCLNMVATQPDRTGIEQIEIIAKAGYDYVELPLAQMSELDNRQFAAVVDRVKHSGLRCEACNNFLPATLRITGEAADHSTALDYGKRIGERLEMLGTELVVMGSSGAKNLPEGFSYCWGFVQIVDFARAAADLLKPYGVRIAIEPLNRLESNIILNAAEGLALVKAIDRENLHLLVDYYHLALERENPAVLCKAGKEIIHLHIADPKERVVPTPERAEQYLPFIKALKEIGYDERISVEAYSNDFERDAPLALQTMRNLLR